MVPIRAAMTARNQVQRRRRCELGERTQPPMRQPRRARRERVEIKHDERSRKADTEGTWYEASACSSQSTVALPDLAAIASPRLLATHGARGEFSPGFVKSHATLLFDTTVEPMSDGEGDWGRWIQEIRQRASRLATASSSGAVISCEKAPYRKASRFIRHARVVLSNSEQKTAATHPAGSVTRVT